MNAIEWMVNQPDWQPFYTHRTVEAKASHYNPRVHSLPDGALADYTSGMSMSALSRKYNINWNSMKRLIKDAITSEV